LLAARGPSMADELNAPERRELDRLIEEHDLARRRPALRKVARPCVYLEEKKAAKRPPVGASRVGGTPDLPAGVEWPQADEGAYLFFVGQINLAECPPTPPLPASGLLSFFVEEDEDAGDVFHQVLYSADTGALKRAKLPGDGEMLLEDRQLEAPRGLRFTRGISLPAYYDQWTGSHFKNDDEALDRYLDLKDALSEEGAVGRMLGYPSFANRSPLPKEKVLLLQLASIDEMAWWDAGAIQFFVGRKQLARGKFTDTEAEIYTS
jgi:uncharacterized protein YwqG